MENCNTLLCVGIVIFTLRYKFVKTGLFYKFVVCLGAVYMHMRYEIALLDTLIFTDSILKTNTK